MAPRDDDKAMDGLLRKSLAREQAAGKECPEPDILAAYFERSLDGVEIAGYEAHFAQCSHCREQLAALLCAESLVANPVAQDFVIAAAAAPRVMAATRAKTMDAPELRKRVRIRVLDWRWLAPVAAVIIVVVFLYLRDTSRVASLRAPANEVAMSRDAELAQPSVADEKSGAAQLKSVPAAPPAAQVHLSASAKSSPAKPASKPSEKESDLANTARAEYQIRNDLRQRAEADTATAMENSVPAEKLAPSAAGTASNDLVLTAQQPAAAPAPPTPSPAKVGAKGEGAGVGGSVGQGGDTTSVMSKKAQSAKTSGAIATDKLGVTSRMMEAKSAAAVIQTPEGAVQYRIGGAGTVERSQDGGATWQGQFLNPTVQILAGAAPSENVCWLVGRRGTILLTTDRMNWNVISPPAKTDLVGVVATDAATATVTAADGRKFATMDGGNTWKLLK